MKRLAPIDAISRLTETFNFSLFLLNLRSTVCDQSEHGIEPTATNWNFVCCFQILDTYTHFIHIVGYTYRITVLRYFVLLLHYIHKLFLTFIIIRIHSCI